MKTIEKTKSSITIVIEMVKERLYTIVVTAILSSILWIGSTSAIVIHTLRDFPAQLNALTESVAEIKAYNTKQDIINEKLTVLQDEQRQQGIRTEQKVDSIKDLLILRQ